jgi:hypothetical protein
MYFKIQLRLFLPNGLFRLVVSCYIPRPSHHPRADFLNDTIEIHRCNKRQATSISLCVAVFN